MYNIEESINTELMFRMVFRQAAYKGECDEHYRKSYLKFCSFAPYRKVVNDKPADKIQYSIGVVPNEDEAKKLPIEVYYDLTQYGYRFEIIFADTLPEIIPLVSGEYLYIIKNGDELCLDNLLWIYEIMKSHPNAGGYFPAEDIREEVGFYDGKKALGDIFLKSTAENDLIYNMSFMRQLSVARWLEELSEAGNMYVKDYGISCCSYLIFLVSDVMVGKRKPGKHINIGNFRFKYRYVDGVIALLNQWRGLVNDSLILSNYRTLVRESFRYLEQMDRDIYISDIQIQNIRDYLLQGVEQILIDWPYNGIRFERVNIRAVYTKFLQQPRLSRLLEEWFYIQSGYQLELENPQTFNQKINWMKLYDNQEIKSTLSDKYAVRAWVRKKIGEKYLLRLIHVWDHAEDINFCNLPDKFVLKVNQGSGFNIVVTDKQDINEKKIIKQLDEWLHTDYFLYGMELQYRNIEPKIICEEYVENSGEGLHDFKVHVFNGKPRYVQYISGRADKSQTTEKWYDTNWQPQNFSYTNPKSENLIDRPQCLDELLNVAEILGSEFAYVRVDLYILNNGQIKFGEMTFTPTNGMDPWKPEEMDLIMGAQIDLSALQKKIDF